MITTPLRIILVEDEETDAVLIKRQIAKIVDKPEIKVVEDIPGFEGIFTGFLPNVIISDYNLPTSTGLDAVGEIYRRNYSFNFCNRCIRRR